jgi:PhnB protein
MRQSGERSRERSISEEEKAMKVNTYLNFGGNCAEALKFYEKELGGKIQMMMTFDQAPDQSMVTPESKNKVMHANMALGDTQIMASDAPADRFQPMRSVYLTLTVDSAKEAERLHATLSPGGEVFMPMQETFWANRFSMLRDKFGTSWMIMNPKPMQGN